MKPLLSRWSVRRKRGRYKLLFLLAFLTASLAVSCSNPGLTPSLDEQNTKVAIQSVHNGRVLTAGEPLTVTLSYDTSVVTPDRAVIELLKTDGTVRFSQDLNQQELGVSPITVTLPQDLEPDAYTFSVTIYQNGEEIGHSQSLFFYVTQPYEILGITPYPQIFYPGGKGLLVANLQIPDGSNPYLRWTVDKQVVAEGYVQDGYGQVQVTAPETEGIYSIRLDLYPVGPDPSSVISYDFSSSVMLEAQVFVSANQTSSASDLSPDDEYYSLFHFRGETTDWGYNGDHEQAADIGNPKLALVDGLFGFYIAPGTGFSVNHDILPIVDGKLPPFSLSARFAITATQQSASIVTVGGGATSAPQLQLGFGADSKLEMTIGGTTSHLASGDVPLNTPTDLTVSFIPETGSARFLWFLNGVMVQDQTVAFTQAEVNSDVTTTIGGPGGMTGVIDELGVYYSPGADGVTVDANVYSRAMELKYGSDFVYADGFDGLAVPGNLKIGGNASGVSVDGNRLLVSAGSSVTLPPISTGFESLSIITETEAAPPSGAVLRVTSQDSGTPVLTYSFDGSYHLPNGTVVKTTPKTTVRIDIVQSARGLSLWLNNQMYILASPPERDVSLALTLANSDAGKNLAVLSMLVYKNRVKTSGS